jgi:hypothetical protein
MFGLLKKDKTEARPQLTEQERNPHPQLVQCRNLLTTVLGLERQQAASICNGLTHVEVDSILEAGTDKTKLEKLVAGK